MTSNHPRRRKDQIAADNYEARIERAIVKTGTVFVLDGEIIMTVQNGCIETCDTE